MTYTYFPSQKANSNTNKCWIIADHDPIVISQRERERFRDELFSGGPDKTTSGSAAAELVDGKKQPPLHVFNGSDIKPGENEVDEHGSSRVLWRAQQIPNRIRRLRSRHVQLDSKVWFTASNNVSFNSRCPASFRFDRTNLDENSRQYYFYR